MDVLGYIIYAALAVPAFISICIGLGIAASAGVAVVLTLLCMIYFKDYGDDDAERL